MPKPICVGELHEHVKTKLMELANSEDKALCKRAKVILLSGDYHTMSEISRSLNLSYLSVRQWIQRFLKEGINGLYTRTDNRGRKETFTEEHKSKVIAIARKSPREYGLPFRKWSISKLSDYLISSEGMHISRETVRRILHSESIDWKNTHGSSNDVNGLVEGQENGKLLSISGDVEKGIALHIDDAGSMTVKKDGQKMWSSKQKVSTDRKKEMANRTNIITTYNPDKKELVIKLVSNK